MHSMCNVSPKVNFEIYTCTVTPPQVVLHGHASGRAHNGIENAELGEAVDVSFGRWSRIKRVITVDGLENVSVDGPDVRFSGELRGAR